MKLFFLHFLLFILLSGCSIYERENAQLTATVTKYNGLYYSINNGDWHMNEGNEEGLYAWCEAFVLQSLINMYKATNDVDYLERFVRHADVMISKTDKALGLVDYRNRSLPAWGAGKRYLDNSDSRCIWTVHTGMIVYPLIEFYNLKHPFFTLNANKYLNAGLEAIKIHDDDFKDGTYFFALDHPKIDLAGKELPYNQCAAIGRALLAEYKANGSTDAYNKTQRIAQGFRNALEYDEANDLYLWKYSSWSLSCEDIAHSYIDFDFAYLCWSNTIVFETIDIQRFANTCWCNILNRQPYPFFIDGSGEVALPITSLYFIKFSQFNPRIEESTLRYIDLVINNLPSNNNRYDSAAAFLEYLSTACLVLSSENKCEP